MKNRKTAIRRKLVSAWILKQLGQPYNPEKAKTAQEKARHANPVKQDNTAVKPQKPPLPQKPPFNQTE